VKVQLARITGRGRPATMQRPVSSPLDDPPELLSDRDLLAEYQRIGGEPGDLEVEAILTEIQRRNLDI
jgi:hypothetical protein